MQASNRTARTAGIIFLLTFVSAIAGAALYAPLLTDPDYITGPGADTRILLGAVCELVLIITNIGTAVVLFPVLRRHSESAAVGYLAARIVECTFIAVGILSILAVVTLRQTAGADAAEYLPVARALVAVHGWTFLLGPGFVVGIGNGLLLGFLMYRAHLVPRPMALFGLIGGPLMSLSGIAVLFGAYGQTSVPSALATLPEIIWEFSLGIYLTFVGFRRPRSTRTTAAALKDSPATGATSKKRHAARG
ncbi:DUF4386 domain-containing protein [Arthrobacter jiangjiafuii]|uniref:DUF4386 domain-containing protein n=1 Tax=Arthrobacter jiangjiafuii TaxID=2817475 RepID=A0A975M841_9MICC|nr:DUF4386 domain-containing protein [Arthrobacter jiangjiafuii]MBP3042999.1 DUF4386 domain-containing protein [Arthrobacter jiangjiafuii]QWC11519.1 DUF4386 domain-containing protein [Arthrobacter jiangjiafuii]